MQGLQSSVSLTPRYQLPWTNETYLFPTIYTRINSELTSTACTSVHIRITSHHSGIGWGRLFDSCYTGIQQHERIKKKIKLVLRKDRAKLMFIQDGSALKGKNFASRDAFSVNTLMWVYRNWAKYMEFLFHFLFLLVRMLVQLGNTRI